MNITDFKSRLRGGGARANRFEVEVVFPTFAGGTEETDKGLFLAKSTSLPASTIGVVEVPFQGRILPIAGDRTFAEWTVTFLNDTDFALRDAFERWSNGINSHEGNTGSVNPEDYMKDISVYQLNNASERIKEYKFRDLFPTEVGNIELGMDSNDAIEEFTVTFRYIDWVSNTTS